MAITVKDTSGAEHQISGRGMTGTALGLGIAGTALGLLDSDNGILGGLGGNGSNGNYVSKDVYFRDLLNQVNIANAQFAGLNDKICDIRERVSVNETANFYQNRISDLLFANVESRFGTERKVTDYEIAAAICNVPKGVPMLRPEQIGDPYHGVRLGMGYVVPGAVCGNAPYGGMPYDGMPYGEGCACR